ncbi:hypothetical protein KHQ82_05895 [Mycoplasmatota bacterium]|nr:hypothetical protein KHQ82_05895 [Mycoplasmatota bacterium]
MKRSKKILLVSHCILNQNSVVEPLARDGKGIFNKLKPFIDDGYGIVQLPCPELKCFGLRRWGHVKNQFDFPHFKDYSRELLKEYVNDIVSYLDNGYDIYGVAGIEGSPSCGCTVTCSSDDWKGDVTTSSNTVKMINGKGIFMTVFKNMLSKKNINLNFFDLVKMND